MDSAVAIRKLTQIVRHYESQGDHEAVGAVLTGMDAIRQVERDKVVLEKLETIIKSIQELNRERA